eukprot:9191771-Pyramimonas_sp.AAC.1
MFQVSDSKSESPMRGRVAAAAGAAVKNVARRDLMRWGRSHGVDLFLDRAQCLECLKSDACYCPRGKPVATPKAMATAGPRRPRLMRHAPPRDRRAHCRSRALVRADHCIWQAAWLLARPPDPRQDR